MMSAWCFAREAAMFDNQSHWTQGPCYYVMACCCFDRAWLADPYPTMATAEDVLPMVRRWAVQQSGDQRAASYRYEVAQHFNGETHSILGVVTL
jgi:hypothetical protein